LKRNQNFSSSRHSSPALREKAEALAIEARGFLAGDAERLSRFLDLSGLTPQTLRAAANQASFLGAVLDYLAADESLLVTFAANGGHDPESVLRARALLSGEGEDAGA
jgi:hypothetical protein